MSVVVKIKDPEKFLRFMQEGIKSNRIKSWKVDDKGKIIHTPSHFGDKGWFNAQIDSINKKITFCYQKPENAIENKALYGSYHGRLVNMLFSHFFRGFEIESVSVQ